MDGCTIPLRERERGDLVDLSDFWCPEKTPLTKEKKERRGDGGLVILVVISSLCCSCLIQTPACLPQHQEKSRVYHAITWPHVCSGKRHLVDVVKMLRHLSLPASFNHSLNFCLFTHYLWFYFFSSLHTCFSFLRCLWSGHSEVLFEMLLFCSPLSLVFFPLSSIFRGEEASNSVTFLCRLCVCLC